MQFGLFGSAAARRGGPEFDSSEGFRDFIDYNIEAEALGFHSTFVVSLGFAPTDRYIEWRGPLLSNWANVRADVQVLLA
jgi:hypothetical protein